MKKFGWCLVFTLLINTIPFSVQQEKENKSSIDHKKKNFEIFFDNLALCHAEFGLKGCLINAPNREYFFQESRIIDCFIEFGHHLCENVKYAVTTSFDNGKVSSDESNCGTTAFADALLVFNQMINDINSALGTSPTLEKWSFINIKLALEASRRDSDCVSTSFLNYINSCAENHFISEEDIQCTHEYLQNVKCDEYLNNGDWWGLNHFLGNYGLIEPNKLIQKLKEVYQVEEYEQMYEAIKDLLVGLSGGGKLERTPLMFDVDEKKSKASAPLCQTSSLPFNIGSRQGIYEEDVYFHFPSESKININGKSVPVDPITTDTIYETCSSYYQTTKALWDAYDINPQTNMEPTRKNMCYSISKYEMHYVESNQRKNITYYPIQFTTLESPGSKCYMTEWDEVSSCHSHLSRWEMTAACCTNYINVKQTNEVIIKSNETLPEIQGKDLMFEKVVASSDHNGRLYFFGGMPDLLQYLDQYIYAPLQVDMHEWFLDLKINKCLNTTNKTDPYTEQLCKYVDSVILSIHQQLLSANDVNNSSNETTTVPALIPLQKPYLSDNNVTKKTSEALNINFNFDEIIVAMSMECHPQSCVLTQLSNCMVLPTLKKAPIFSADNITTSFLSRESSSSMSTVILFAAVGFISGLIVMSIGYSYFLSSTKKNQNIYA